MIRENVRPEFGAPDIGPGAPHHASPAPPAAEAIAASFKPSPHDEYRAVIGRSSEPLLRSPPWRPAPPGAIPAPEQGGTAAAHQAHARRPPGGQPTILHVSRATLSEHPLRAPSPSTLSERQAAITPRRAAAPLAPSAGRLPNAPGVGTPTPRRDRCNPHAARRASRGTAVPGRRSRGSPAPVSVTRSPSRSRWTELTPSVAVRLAWRLAAKRLHRPGVTFARPLPESARPPGDRRAGRRHGLGREHLGPVEESGGGRGAGGRSDNCGPLTARRRPSRREVAACTAIVNGGSGGWAGRSLSATDIYGAGSIGCGRCARRRPLAAEPRGTLERHWAV